MFHCSDMRCGELSNKLPYIVMMLLDSRQYSLVVLSPVSNEISNSNLVSCCHELCSITATERNGSAFIQLLSEPRTSSLQHRDTHPWTNDHLPLKVDQISDDRSVFIQAVLTLVSAVATFELFDNHL